MASTKNRFTRALLLSAAWPSARSSSSSSSSLSFPSLHVVENALLTTAKDDFGGHAKAFEVASTWNAERLRGSNSIDDDIGNSKSISLRASHLACAEYRHGRHAFERLQSLLLPESVQRVSNSEEHGACFFATASQAEAATILEDRDNFELASFAPFPSALKLAPGLLEHGTSRAGDQEASDKPDGVAGRLAVSHGPRMRTGNVIGLTVEFTPGTLRSADDSKSFIKELLGDLNSEALDLRSTNFWSDPAMTGGEHLATPGGAVLGRDWTRAATVVHELSEAAGTSPGDICSWDSVALHHPGNDILLVGGVDHLLYSGRGAGGRSHEGEAEELHVACFMGLVSYLAGRLDVLRVSPRHAERLLNAVARSIIQSATVTDTALTDAGLDGTGEVIQVIDTGLDETSCFFVDTGGGEVVHGHYYNELAIPSLTSTYYAQGNVFYDFDGGDFSSSPERRKVIQYIDMVDPDSEYSYFASASGAVFPFFPADGFEEDDAAGHGTHTAGSAAGSTVTTPANTTACEPTQTLSCVGACLDNDVTGSTDDLVTTFLLETVDLDRLCPLFRDDCDEEPTCLGDDPSVTLSENGGMAQGAKLSIFDAFYGDYGLSSLIGNALWEPCLEDGCKIHSNSLGSLTECSLTVSDLLYDEFMYENPENLLVFAAGNDGDNVDDACTISSPALGKNALAVGATTSGDTRFVITPDASGIDTVAIFSSFGPTTDGRIKPEVVAPGDSVYSAASDGTNTNSCRLWAYQGTSMSCPIVAGASAMVRQYFVDETFYAADVTARDFCSDIFVCEAFSPSAATVKALLINSANLMGGTSEPDGFRGFGRIHLEAGMPLGGEDDLVLFVADSSVTEIAAGELQEYLFDVDADAGLDFRATLSWIDPPATSSSASQLVHNLDLYVVSPSGERLTMWGSNLVDMSNVNERVIVDAEDVETGTWTVWVWANALMTDTQSYSLVVNGAISPATGEGATGGSTFETTSDLIDDEVASSGSLVVPPVALMSVLCATAAAAAAAVFLA